MGWDIKLIPGVKQIPGDIKAQQSYLKRYSPEWKKALSNDMTIKTTITSEPQAIKIPDENGNLIDLVFG